MRRKSIFVIIIMIVSVFSSGCSKGQTDKGFFAWMDAYIAAEKDAGNTIAVTMFFENKPFDEKDVSNISFIDINKDVMIEHYTIEDSGKKDKKYSSYSFTLDYRANEAGVYKTSGILINLASNETLEYTIGDWVFDIGEQNSEVLDTWSSPAATSNKDEFPYDYTVTTPGYVIKEIYYGLDSSLDGEPEDKGAIRLEPYSSPFVYIKSKVVLEKDGRSITNYGKGCYCGAMSLPEELPDFIDVSKEHNMGK